MGSTRQLDLRGEECPFTVVQLSRAMRMLRSGDRLEVIVNDEAATEDVRAWCEATGHEFLESRVGVAVKVRLTKA